MQQNRAEENSTFPFASWLPWLSHVARHLCRCVHRRTSKWLQLDAPHNWHTTDIPLVASADYCLGTYCTFVMYINRQIPIIAFLPYVITSVSCSRSFIRCRSPQSEPVVYLKNDVSPKHQILHRHPHWPSPQWTATPDMTSLPTSGRKWSRKFCLKCRFWSYFWPTICWR